MVGGLARDSIEHLEQTECAYECLWPIHIEQLQFGLFIRRAWSHPCATYLAEGNRCLISRSCRANGGKLVWTCIWVR